ncbi:MAG: response regulator [Ignavibacteriales bacterium]|nr:response regulator [Ignavibacteriales bacterium]
MKTILIVDDEIEVLKVLKNLLEPEGYRVFTAEDGEEAKSIIKKNGEQFSAILLDWSMPKLSGIEVLRWIKAQRQFEYLPVIMHTAMKHSQNIREGIEAGAFYYLTKPTDGSIIISIVNAAVDDFNHLKNLLSRLQESKNPFKFLTEGIFRFKTLEEAEFLGVRIANTCPNPEKAIVISELLVNAVEHGNLEISYDDKTEYFGKGIYNQILNQRLSQAPFADRFVEVKLQRFPDKMMVTIEDQGMGFDYQKYLTLDEDRVFDVHGRGIAIANMYVRLKYLDKGNKVEVTIPCE